MALLAHHGAMAPSREGVGESEPEADVEADPTVPSDRGTRVDM